MREYWMDNNFTVFNEKDTVIVLVMRLLYTNFKT